MRGRLCQRRNLPRPVLPLPPLLLVLLLVLLGATAKKKMRSWSERAENAAPPLFTLCREL